MSALRLPRWLGGYTAADDLQDSEWERRETLLRQGELIEDDPGTGLLETHWAPRRPRSTLTMPREPGFYAQRINSARNPQPWAMVEVVADAHGDLWWAPSPRMPATRLDRTRRGMYEWSDAPYVLPD